jgi:integrase
MSRPRDRHASLGLLPRMEARVGKRATSYRYRPIEGKPIPLGTDKAAAIRRVIELTGRSEHHGSLRWVWESYQKGRRFTRLADATRGDYAQCWKQLDPIFGHMQISTIDSPMVARYVRLERADAPRRANMEKALLSNLFAHGIDLGVCTTNPAKVVRPNETEPRTEAPDAAVLARFAGWVMRQSPQRRIVGLAARFVALVGSRQVEFRPLTTLQLDLDAAVVRVTRAKQRGRKRDRVFEEVALSPEAIGVVREALAARPNPDSTVIFQQRNGNAYTDRGFKTLWQRIMLAAIAEGVLEAGQRFTFHDLRAHFATRFKEVTGELPDLHKNPETTARVYDRTKIVKRRSL